MIKSISVRIVWVIYECMDVFMLRLILWLYILIHHVAMVQLSNLCFRKYLNNYLFVFYYFVFMYLRLLLVLLCMDAAHKIPFHGIARALLRLVRTMNLLCHYYNLII